MPLEGHPDDCACCVKISFTPGARGRHTRTAEEADLATFLPQQPPPEEEEDEEDEQPEWIEEEEAEEVGLLNATLFQSFDAHVAKLDAARLKRIEALSFKSALEDDGEGEVNADASLDEIEGLGVWQAGDDFQGDVNYRTLTKLLARVDKRGFERYAHASPLRFSHALRTRYPTIRSAQQLEFHVAFMKAAARVIYRGSWETERPAIMKKHGWEKSNSEVLIRCTLNPTPLDSRPMDSRLCVRSTPRRFGKTFSIAIFCACLSLAFGLEVRACVRIVVETSLPSPTLTDGGAGRCVQPGAQSVPQAPRAHCRVTAASQTPGHAHCALRTRVDVSQVCPTGRRREAHLRVQPGAPHRPQSAPRPLTPRSVRRRLAALRPSTAANRSYARSRRKWGCVPSRLEPALGGLRATEERRREATSLPGGRRG